MRLLTVVGARPQFVKAAPVSRELARQGLNEILVHTGQHYDCNMSEQFFRELDLPVPRHHLGIGSADHGAQTGRMLEALETVMLAEKPDAVLVYGDTNSTLAGALAAAKLNLSGIHIEAGLRSFNRSMPEEINRIVVDHVCGLLLAPTAAACSNLRAEGIPELPKDAGPVQRRDLGFIRAGDVMKDALLDAAKIAAQSHHPFPDLPKKQYYLVSIHRPANTDDPQVLGAWIEALKAADLPVVLPLHPRTRACAERFQFLERFVPPLRAVEPLGYLAMIAAQRDAKAILTDSGGVQKEAYLLGVPCVTLRTETEWVETLADGWNQLCPSPDLLWNCVARIPGNGVAPAAIFGEGRISERVVRCIIDWL